LDYLAEDAWNKAKSAWHARHRWRAPPGESWASLSGEISEQSAARLIAAAGADPDSPLILMIDSDGGELESAIEIYAALRSRPAPVSCHVAQQCCSAAILPLLGGDVRTAERGATLLIHNVARHPGAQFAGRATAELLRSEAAELDELDRSMADIIEWRCRLPPWQIANALRDERVFNTTEGWHAGLLTQAPR
jgi:ATP-dependent protease ClpP protease subunit